MLKSGPAYTIDFNQAKSQGITTPTSKKGTYAQGFTLRWQKGVPTFLPRSLRVPKWCYLDDSNNLVYVETQDAYDAEMNVWERVGEYEDEENAAACVHLYYNYMMQQPCFAKARGCGPMIPLLDVQQWDSKPHPVTPMFVDCNRWKLRDSLTMHLFWKLTTLYGLLVLDATGIAHLDLSPNNVFKIQCRPCCVQYKDKQNERIYLPWTLMLTDFDDYSVAWRNANERRLKEAEGVKALLCKHWTNAHFYTYHTIKCVPLSAFCCVLTGCGVCRQDATRHEQWLKGVLYEYQANGMEKTIMYILADLKQESELQTTSYPEAVQHHFDTTLYVDDFVDTHRADIRQTMSKYTFKWEMPRLSVAFPYSCITNDDWRTQKERTVLVTSMSESHKRSFDLLLA